MFLARTPEGWCLAWGEDRIPMQLEHADSLTFPTRKHAIEMIESHGWHVLSSSHVVWALEDV